MTTTTAASVHCPELVCAGCGGEAVTARYGAKTVEVAPCSSLIRQGWQGDVQVALWHNQALQVLTPVAVSTPVRHVDGLVAFGG